MRHFVAVSARSPEDLHAAQQAARRGLERVEREVALRELRPSTTLRLVTSGDDASERGESWGLGAAPAPFAAVTCDAGRDELVARTDDCGLLHLYHGRSGGLAAVGSSAVAVAAALGQGPDLDTLGTLALLGQTFRDDTPFEGVRRTLEGQELRLAGGRLEVSDPPPSVALDVFATRADATRAGAEALRGILAGVLADVPEPTIELSGGLDSRLLLAAVAPDVRRGLRAVTIGDPLGGDARIAARLARAEGLRHEFYSTVGIDELTGSAVLALTERAARAADFSANPIPRAVLDHVNGQGMPGERLSGQNGEYARGFYYPGQREAPTPDEERVRRLLKWRILLHERVDRGLFTAAFLERALERTEKVVQGFFDTRGTSWLRATDEYYLRVRMHGWVGNTYSAEARRRRILCPLFHPDFLDWARRVPPAWRRGSRAVAAVLCELDPALARVPLASGISPASLASGGVGAALWALRSTGSKLLRKTLQRLRSTTASPGGTARVFAHHLGRPQRLGELFPRSFELGIVVPRLARASLRESGLRWTSYGYLWNLESSLGGDPR